MLTIIELPDTESGIAAVQFEIERIDFAAPEASGRQGGVQAGWPLWRARFELDRVDPVSGDQWRAFFSRLRGRIRRFRAGDPVRPFPLAHAAGFAGMVRAGGGAFDGSATGWSQAIDGSGDARITLSGLPAALMLSQGDYIGFRWDGAGDPPGSLARRTMARAVENAQADGAGVVQVMTEPPLNTAVVPVGAAAHLDRAQCVMQLIPEDSSLGPVSRGRSLGGAAVSAIQDLRA